MMLWTDEKINELCVHGAFPGFLEDDYVNRLLVDDMRNDYEMALTYANNRLTDAAAEIERLTAENKALRWLAASELSLADFEIDDRLVDMAAARHGVMIVQPSTNSGEAGMSYEQLEAV